MRPRRSAARARTLAAICMPCAICSPMTITWDTSMASIRSKQGVVPARAGQRPAGAGSIWAGVVRQPHFVPAGHDFDVHGGAFADGVGLAIAGSRGIRAGRHQAAPQSGSADRIPLRIDGWMERVARARRELYVREWRDPDHSADWQFAVHGESREVPAGTARGTG